MVLLSTQSKVWGRSSFPYILYKLIDRLVLTMSAHYATLTILRNATAMAE